MLINFKRGIPDSPTSSSTSSTWSSCDCYWCFALQQRPFLSSDVPHLIFCSVHIMFATPLYLHTLRYKTHRRVLVLWFNTEALQFSCSVVVTSFSHAMYRTGLFCLVIARYLAGSQHVESKCVGPGAHDGHQSFCHRFRLVIKELAGNLSESKRNVKSFGRGFYWFLGGVKGWRSLLFCGWSELLSMTGFISLWNC